MASKLNTIKKHFRRRLKERFNLQANDDILGRLWSQIKKGTAKCLYKDSLTRSCFKVNLNDVEFAVIYSKKYKTFITALPLDWAEEMKEKMEKKSDEIHFL